MNIVEYLGKRAAECARREKTAFGWWGLAGKVAGPAALAPEALDLVGLGPELLGGKGIGQGVGWTDEQLEQAAHDTNPDGTFLGQPGHPYLSFLGATGHSLLNPLKSAYLGYKSLFGLGKSKEQFAADYDRHRTMHLWTPPATALSAAPPTAAPPVVPSAVSPSAATPAGSLAAPPVPATPAVPRPAVPATPRGAGTVAAPRASVPGAQASAAVSQFSADNMNKQVRQAGQDRDNMAFTRLFGGNAAGMPRKPSGGVR